MKKLAAPLFCLALAALFVWLHYRFGWEAFAADAAAHGEPAARAAYRIEWARDVFENLQSELFQLALQFLILAGLLSWLGVRAHEEDQEEVKARIGRIETLLANRGRAPRSEAPWTEEDAR